MKKLISILITTVLTLSSIVTAFAVPLNSRQESNDINSFIDGITELVQEYDANKKFAVAENDESSQIQNFSAPNADTETGEVRANTFTVSASEETENGDTDKYTLQDFQTARLIVRANGKFDKFGALEDVSGFEDFHILQYESPEAAMEAYEKLSTEKNVTNVAPDEVVHCTQGEKGKIVSASEVKEKDYLCNWSVDRTQSKRLQEYLAESDTSMKEVVVGVVDSGVDYNHDFLKNRIIRTYFNASSDGNLNDEMDNESECHGTAVSSVIVDNSPENVKVAVYRVVANDGKTSSISQICAGYLRAIEDTVDVISVSLGHGDQSGMVEACVLQAYSKNIPFFVAAGNSGLLDVYTLPANIPECITVSATDRNNTVTLWSTLSLNTDISAPGEDIFVAVIHNEYEVRSGTSFSAPCVAALGAILKSIYPQMTVEQMDARLKETSIDVKLYNYYESVQGNSMDNYYSLWDGVGMIQFCNALELEKPVAPEISLEDKTYVGEQTCTITCLDEDATMLYTIDGTYPALENSNIYTEPLQITQRTRIRAVAYYADKGYYSDEVEATPRIQYTDSDENFVIDDEGIIKRYTGNISDLYVPETINGITTMGFSKGAFNTVIGLTLPETVTEIPEGAFYKTQLEFICAKGALNIGGYAFKKSNIIYGEFPQARTIGEYSFQDTYPLCSVYFPNAETIKRGAFSNSGLISFYGPNVKTSNRAIFEKCTALEIVCLPKFTEFNLDGSSPYGEFHGANSLIIVEMPFVQNLFSKAFYDTCISNANFPCVTEIGFSAFYDCRCLEYINMPALLSVPKQAFSGTFHSGIKTRIFRLDSVTQIEQDAFGTYPTSRVEFSHLESAKSLPQTEGCIITMPSTFQKCNEKTMGRNYKIYGTKGTYAEQWANENGHEFIEISQETAILQDVPMEYTEDMDVLSPDVIGFNRTYQWYANDTADNMTGTPIEGATNKDINPADYPAKYYYCVVTSADVGYEPIEIRTGITANKALASADYSAYDAIVLKANALEREYYKDLMTLDTALAVNVRGLTTLDQSIVDEQTKAIEEALQNLEFKDADYSAYNAAVEKANALDKNLYADTTELDCLLAEDISGLTILDQEIVDNQTRAIEDALKNLALKPADYTEYNKAVEQANTLDRSLYVDLTAVDEALAVDVSGKNITEQADVDNQTQKILNAISGLAYKSADYKEYYKAVEQANAIDRSLYVDLTALDAALAIDVSNKNITEQAEVDAQTQAILDAINGLAEKEIPTEPVTPTEPETPAKPIDPTEPTNTGIPNTGAELPFLCSFLFIFLCGAVILASARRKKTENKDN